VTGVITARGVVKRATGRLGPITVIDGLDLTLEAGQVTGVVGPSLAGKTTLVSLLAGWERPDGGELTWAASGPPTWQDVAVIPQGFAVLEELTVAENILLAERVGGPAVAPERLVEVCRAVGIAHLRDRFVTEISVGERQRTMVARALIGRPPCLLADEPIAHQDERNGRAVLALLRAAADAGAAVLLSTRNPEVVDGIADTVVHLPAGR
jgi:ABC-type multidrug transport system ATPase subunit